MFSARDRRDSFRNSSSSWPISSSADCCLYRKVDSAIVRFTFIRPILGGIAGLFLYLVATNSQAITFTYPYLYAAAIAFGFSEYALTDALSATADRVSAQVNKAMPQCRRPPALPVIPANR